MQHSVDVVVVGVGGMGSAALMHLAKRGHKVVGIEQFGVAHDRGSSTGESRIIRKAYFEDPRYVPLLERAYQLWRALEAETSTSLLTMTGCLNFGPKDHPAMVALRACVQQHGLAHERLDRDEIKRRFPAIVPGDDDEGLYEDDGGVLGPEACVRAHVEVASRHGARLVLHERVVDVAVGTHGATVTTEQGTRLMARAVVVAFGPWWATQPFLRPLARSLVVTRQVQCWFPAVDVGPLPAFIRFDDEGPAFYGLPPHAGRGVKACRHGGGARTTADTVDREVHDDDVLEVRGFLRRFLPCIDGPASSSKVCPYTMTPDEHFVVGALPEHPHVVVLGGFSGHGFKMASVIGELAADLVESGTTRLPIELFDPRRLLAQQ